jgi:hypothetical protein
VIIDEAAGFIVALNSPVALGSFPQQVWSSCYWEMMSNSLHTETSI